MPAFSLLSTPAVFTVDLLREQNAPLPTQHKAESHGFGTKLSPVKFSAQNHLTSELLRTLSMMAASEPTSWLFMQSHIVHHLALI